MTGRLILNLFLLNTLLQLLQSLFVLLDLSAQEEGYIDDSIKAGEGLLVAGGVRVPLKDDFPKGALYDLFNTKPEEIAQIKRAQAFARAREGGDA